MNMNGCPVPDLRTLFSLVSTRILPRNDVLNVAEQGVSPYPTHSPMLSPAPCLPANCHYPVSYPGVQFVNHDVGHPSTAPRRKEIMINTHYIECCKCHKKRAVPMYWFPHLIT